MRSALTTSAFAAAILAAACSGSVSTTGAGGNSGGATGSETGTGAGGGSGPSAAKACADAAHASCTELDTCSQNGFLNAVLYGSEATCETRTALPCPSSLAATGTAQTPAHLELCVATYPAVTCTDFLDGNPTTACVPPAGSLAMGAPCGAAGQCMSTFCATGSYQVCGTCEPLPAAGSVCQSSGDCGRDLACVKPANASPQAEGKCAAFVAAGSACLTGVAPCAAGLACVGDSTVTMTMGTCQAAAKALMAPCDAVRKTMPNCDGDLGLVCIPSAKGTAIGTCQAIQLADAGAPCGILGSMPVTGYAECKAGAACIKATLASLGGTCVAPAADGAACDSDPTKGPTCLAPAKCVPAKGSPQGTTAGTCTVPDPAKCM
jgi:hypothetical protein